MKRGRGGARPGAGRISDRSKDLATHYTTEAVPESASKRLKCKHCDWHEQGQKGGGGGGGGVVVVKGDGKIFPPTPTTTLYGEEEENPGF